MTLYELSEEYGRAATALWTRIKQLEQEGKEEKDEGKRLQLRGRTRPLRAMYRETRQVEKHLANYYRRGGK